MAMAIRVLARIPKDSRISMIRTGGMTHVPMVNVNDGAGGKHPDLAIYKCKSLKLKIVYKYTISKPSI